MSKVVEFAQHQLRAMKSDVEAGSGSICFIDLPTQQARIRPAIEKRLLAILDHGRYIAGPEIEELEEQLQAHTGAPVAVACSSGTDALIAPLLARGLVTGDAVFVPAMTYNATANAVLLTGAAPVFVDIDPHTFNMCPKALRDAVDHVKRAGRLRPRAIIPVDLFGSPADYKAISQIAADEELYLLSDGAQSYGGDYDGAKVGNIAPVTATSFFPGKALGAYGDAGAMFSQDEQDRDEFLSIRWHGTDHARKDSVRVGFNGRMDSFQAAVLLEKLAIFDDELASRRHLASIYEHRLGGLANCQRHHPDAKSGYGYFSMTVKARDFMVDFLKEKGVPTAVYYRTPLHQMPAFEAFAPHKQNMPAVQHTEQTAASILSLPIHPYLSERDVNYICDQVEAGVYAAEKQGRM